MTRLLRFGVIATLCVPFSVFAGATLADIEGTAETTVQSSAVKSRPKLAASASADKNNAPIEIVESAPTYQFYSSDKAAELQYERNGSVFGLENDRAVVSFLMNEERDNALTAAVMFDTEFDMIRGLKLSFGPRMIAGLLSIENADVIGFAASLEALYIMPLEKFPLRLSSGVSYAPDILTFGQSDRIIDWNFRAGLPLTKNIEGFVGARYLQFDTRPGERKLDQQVHIGIRWSGKS